MEPENVILAKAGELQDCVTVYGTEKTDSLLCASCAGRGGELKEIAVKGIYYDTFEV